MSASSDAVTARRALTPGRHHSTCPHDCPSTCALDVEVLDDMTIGRVYGAKDNDYTAGVICAKVSRYKDRIHHPDRLARPLRRTGAKGSGLAAFEPVDWDDALDIVAENMQRVIREYSAEAIWPYHYAGTMGLVQRDSLDRFRHCLGTSRQHATFCVTLADAGWTAGIGAKIGSDARNMVNSDVIVVWGGNPVNTQVNVMHHIAKAKRQNDAQLVVVDPYLTRTAKKADLHLMPKPGTDGALACAVMHILFRDNLADRAYLATHTDLSEEVETHLSSKTPEWASAITGIPVEQIEAFAALYGSSKRTFIRCGYGFSRSRNGAVNMHAVTCLPAVTGAWQVEGGGALYSHREIYPINDTVIKGLDAVQPTRVLDQSRIGEVLCGNSKDLADGPAIKSLFVQNTNPLIVAPDTNRVREGLAREDLFVCVHEQFMTETAEYADIVLPATMFLEHDDMYIASGHTYLQVTEKLVEPYAECRTNHQVLCSLAQRLGLEHEGFSLNEWELLDRTLRDSGFEDVDTIRAAKWKSCELPFEQSNFLHGFSTPDRKFHFKPDWSRVGPNSDGMPTMPEHWDNIDRVSDEYPFRLVAAPARQFLNTTFTETESARKMEKSPGLMMHPEDCQALNLNDDELVNVSSTVGTIQLKVRYYEGLQPGTVVVESIWGNRDFPGGSGVNTLVSSEPGQPNGGAVFHDTAVRVSRA